MASQPDLVAQLFEAALALKPAEREAFLGGPVNTQLTIDTLPSSPFRSFRALQTVSQSTPARVTYQAAAASAPQR